MLVLPVVLVLTVAIGAGVARGVLGLVVRAITAGGLSTTPALRTAATALLALIR